MKSNLLPAATAPHNLISEIVNLKNWGAGGLIKLDNSILTFIVHKKWKLFNFIRKTETLIKLDNSILTFIGHKNEHIFPWTVFATALVFLFYKILKTGT